MRLVWTLLALAIASALLFAVHIRLARADAWEDAWQALALRFSTDRTMVKSRIGDFTWWQWLQQQFQFLGNGIGPVGWGLAITGASCSFACRRSATEGMRWLSWGALCFFVMNALYLLIWRNASYNHDYAGFYFAVPVAILGGIGLSAILDWAERNPGHTLRKTASWATTLALITLQAVWGYSRTRALHRVPYHMLDCGRDEPRNLMPRFGQAISQAFPEDTKILCNFPWYSPQLEYYACRPIIFKLATYDDWQAHLSRPGQRIGGLIWLEATGARELLASLPRGSRQLVQFGEFQFCLWKPDVSTAAFTIRS
jgi:hypothetical protein